MESLRRKRARNNLPPSLSSSTQPRGPTKRCESFRTQPTYPGDSVPSLDGSSQCFLQTSEEEDYNEQRLPNKRPPPRRDESGALSWQHHLVKSNTTDTHHTSPAHHKNIDTRRNKVKQTNEFAPSRSTLRPATEADESQQQQESCNNERNSGNDHENDKPGQNASCEKTNSRRRGSMPSTITASATTIVATGGRRQSVALNDDEDGARSHGDDKKRDKSVDRKSTTPEQQQRPQRAAWRETVGRLINNDNVQLVIILLIVVNAVLMGVGTFFDSDNEDDNAAAILEQVDQAFLILFSVELCLQLIYHGPYLFRDGWLVFDFVIIFLSWTLNGFQIIRAFRIFRAFRLVSRLQVLKNLVLALFAVAPSMLAIISLLVLILYIFAVLCTEFFRNLHAEGYLDQDYFGTLDRSLFTLFTMMTLEWADVVRAVQQRYEWAWVIFTPFVVMTSFILYSLIIAVVCDAVNVTEHADEQETEISDRKHMEEYIGRLEDRLAVMTRQQHELLHTLQQVLAEASTSSNESTTHAMEESWIWSGNDLHLRTDVAADPTESTSEEFNGRD